MDLRPGERHDSHEISPDRRFVKASKGSLRELLWGFLHVDGNLTCMVLQFNELLGSGAFKSVFRAYDRESGTEVAWNEVNLRRMRRSERARLKFEVEILSRLAHPHIIKYSSHWKQQQNTLVFITELVSSGTLKQYVQRVGSLKLRVIKGWAKQILEALNYLHTRSPPIIHRDLKCDNILINGTTSNILLGDFGLSTYVGKITRVNSVLGTPNFMAPEMYDESYNEKVDIFAFGMSLLELVTRKLPYSECTNAAQIYKKVLQHQLPQAFSRVLHPQLKAFIHRCIAYKPEDRPTAQELLQSSFLQPAQDDHLEPAIEPDTTEDSDGAEAASNEWSRHEGAGATGGAGGSVGGGGGGSVGHLDDDDKHDTWSHSHVSTARQRKIVELDDSRASSDLSDDHDSGHDSGFEDEPHRDTMADESGLRRGHHHVTSEDVMLNMELDAHVEPQITTASTFFPGAQLGHHVHQFCLTRRIDVRQQQIHFTFDVAVDTAERIADELAILGLFKSERASVIKQINFHLNAAYRSSMTHMLSSMGDSGHSLHSTSGGLDGIHLAEGDVHRTAMHASNLPTAPPSFVPGGISMSRQPSRMSGAYGSMVHVHPHVSQLASSSYTGGPHTGHGTPHHPQVTLMSPAPSSAAGSSGIPSFANSPAPSPPVTAAATAQSAVPPPVPVSRSLSMTPRPVVVVGMSANPGSLRVQVPGSSPAPTPLGTTIVATRRVPATGELGATPVPAPGSLPPSHATSPTLRGDNEPHALVAFTDYMDSSAATKPSVSIARFPASDGSMPLPSSQPILTPQYSIGGKAPSN